MSLRLDLLDSAVELTGPAQLLDRAAALFPQQEWPVEDPVEHRLDVAGLDVLVDGRLVQRAPCAARVLETLLMVLNAVVVEDVRSLAVHAGCVSADGRAVAWPAVSGSGKSTLTAACVASGLELVSDEALVVEQGRVRPYPKPVSLSAWSLHELGLPGCEPGTAERPVAVAELGRPATEGPVLAHVVVLSRRDGAPTLEPVSRATAAALLLEHSFNHYKRPREAFLEAGRSAAQVQCWTLGYGHPSDGAELVGSLLARA